jgi:hypothetical protein
MADATGQAKQGGGLLGQHGFRIGPFCGFGGYLLAEY